MLVLPMVRRRTRETVMGVTDVVLRWVVEEMLVWGMDGVKEGVCCRFSGAI